MFDDPRSRESETLAFQAEIADGRNDVEQAKQLYASAAELEEAVVADVPSSSVRVKRVLAISAVSLWIKAREPARASDLARAYIAAGIATEADFVEMVHVQMASSLTRPDVVS